MTNNSLKSLSHKEENNNDIDNNNGNIPRNNEKKKRADFPVLNKEDNNMDNSKK